MPPATPLRALRTPRIWSAPALAVLLAAGCRDSVTAPPVESVVGTPTTSVGVTSLSTARYPGEWSVYPDSNPAGYEPAYAIRIAVLGYGMMVDEIMQPKGPLLGTVGYLGTPTVNDSASAAALRGQFDVLVITNGGGENVTSAGIDAYLDAGGGVILEDTTVRDVYGWAPRTFDPTRTYKFPPPSSAGMPQGDPALTRIIEGALAANTLTFQAILHSTSATMSGMHTPFIHTVLGPTEGAPGAEQAIAVHGERSWGAGNQGGRYILQGISLAACAAPSCQSMSNEQLLLLNEIRWVARNAINQPPRAEAGGNAGADPDVHYAGAEGSAVTFDGSAFDNEFGPGTRLTMSWDFQGDGTADLTGSSLEIVGALRGSYTWADEGNHTARFSVTDANGLTRTDVVPVRVANVAPTVTVAGNVTVQAGRRLNLPVSFADPGADDAPWTYTVRWGDETTATPGSTGTLASMGAFTPTHTYTSVGVYPVTVELTDEDGGQGVASLQVTVVPFTNEAPTASAGGPYAGTEGSPSTLSAARSTDPDGDELTYAWDLDGDGSYDDATGVTASFTGVDDGTYTVAVQVSDGDASSTASSTVTVANAAPALAAVSFPASPVRVGTSVTVSAAFTDPGAADTHIAHVQWDVDGAFEPAVVSNGSASATRVLAAGVYTVTLRLRDDDGGADDETTIGYVVVYDPSGPFVTGGGWIHSAAGDCTLMAACASASGNATFGFVSRYRTGAAAPSGNFEFTAGGFRFRSTTYRWLVVAGARAQYKGEGTVNGGGAYGFLVTAVDGAVNGGGGDRFRIKVWEIATGAVVYDNRRGIAEDSDAAANLGGGSIVIHK